MLKLVPGEAAGFAVPPLEAIQREAERAEHGHFNLLHHESGLRADIYLASADPLDTWGLAHRRQESLGDEPVWVAPAEYVIVRKLEYFRQGGSTKHLTDIRAILRIRPDLVDLTTLADFVGRRGLSAEWSTLSKPD